MQLDKDGNPLDADMSVLRKESAWAIFSKVRIFG